MAHKHKWTFMGVVLGGEKNGMAHRSCPGCGTQKYRTATEKELKKHDPNKEVEKNIKEEIDIQLQSDAFLAVLSNIASWEQFHEGHGGCHGPCPVCAAKTAVNNAKNKKYHKMEVFTKGWDEGYEEGVKRGKEIAAACTQKKT